MAIKAKISAIRTSQTFNFKVGNCNKLQFYCSFFWCILLAFWYTGDSQVIPKYWRLFYSVLFCRTKGLQLRFVFHPIMSRRTVIYLTLLTKICCIGTNFFQYKTRGIVSNTKYQPIGKVGTRSTPATLLRLQPLTACLIQNGRLGLEIGHTQGYWTPQTTFAKQVFWFDHSFYENLKHPKWPPGGPKMADGVWRGVYP